MYIQHTENIQKRKHSKFLGYHEVNLIIINILSTIKSYLRHCFTIKTDRNSTKNIQIVSSTNYILVCLFDNIDWRECKKFKKALFRLMQQKKSIRINFSQLKQLDVSIIAILLETITYANSKNIELSFEVVKGQPYEVLKLNNVDRIFAQRSYYFNLLSHCER